MILIFNYSVIIVEGFLPTFTGTGQKRLYTINVKIQAFLA